MKIGTKSKLWILIICILIPLLIGFLGGIFTSSSVDSWYLTINKPGFNPPSWIFAPVWTILYIMMGIALYFIVVSENTVKKTALIVFAVQLGLNFLWSILFFGLKNPFLGLSNILILWVWIAGTIIYFFNINKKAGWLLIPYILWVSFASVLNYFIWVLN